MRDDGKVPWADGRESKGKAVNRKNTSQYIMSMTVSCAGLLVRAARGDSRGHDHHHSVLDGLALKLSFAANLVG